jgi:hypothetical protein
VSYLTQRETRCGSATGAGITALTTGEEGPERRGHRAKGCDRAQPHDITAFSAPSGQRRPVAKPQSCEVLAQLAVVAVTRIH